MAANKNIFREILSGSNGKLSAKRVVGAFAMSVALGCTVYLVISDGSNSVVENLLMTIFITSVSLLGLPAVTGAWGSSRVNIGKDTETEEAKDDESENEPIPPIPDCDHCEYKNRHKPSRNKKGTT